METRKAKRTPKISRTGDESQVLFLISNSVFSQLKGREHRHFALGGDGLLAPTGTKWQLALSRKTSSFEKENDLAGSDDLPQEHASCKDLLHPSPEEKKKNTSASPSSYTSGKEEPSMLLSHRPL